MRCPKCNAKNREDEAFCVSCGVEIKAYIREQESQVNCASCGRPNDKDSEFCTSCGERIGAPKPVAVSPVPPAEALPCPRCSKTMTPGFVIAVNGGPVSGGLKWSAEQSHSLFWGLEGEQLIDGVMFRSFLDIQAWRCPECRIVAFPY